MSAADFLDVLTSALLTAAYLTIRVNDMRRCPFENIRK